MNKTYFTKSRLKLAMECPRKLYYSQNKEYDNQKVEDPFLMELANGGFQVGELAKHYYAGGYDLRDLSMVEAIEKTKSLLTLDEVIIYEATFISNNLLVRSDILVKKGNQIDIIEVKSKSHNFEEGLVGNNGKLPAKWKDIIEDIAFQKYVISELLSEYNINPYLMLADKNAKCPTDGLNQKFKIKMDSNGYTQIITDKITEEDLSVPILRRIRVDNSVDDVYNATYGINMDKSFVEYVEFLSSNYIEGGKISGPISKKCKTCEFQTSPDDEALKLLSGFKQCWMEELGWIDKDFLESNVLEIWNFRSADKLIKAGKIKLSDVEKDDIGPVSDGKPGLSTSQRQWLQIEKAVNYDNEYWLDKDGLLSEMKNWKYPLHFIDFETTMSAIPFNQGRRPYEGIAFQFSHHVYNEDGSIKHFGEYLNTKFGYFPNYDFLRELKKQLENDEGTIFRYANHENSYLNIIYNQLLNEESYIEDKEDLLDFIRTITKSTGNSDEAWLGSRNMVDMCELVIRYYYDPSTKGSNSIKKVLPAVLNSSDYLKEKYSKPIYGADGGIESLNYRDKVWVLINDGKVEDPYKLLPKMFEGASDDLMANLLSDNELLNQGGAAMNAYSKYQFEEMTEYERREIESALLKYCELDTLAMIMIYEAWRYWLWN